MGWVRFADEAQWGDHLAAERLATLVAASGAFPGAFNAVKLTKNLLLSDGGLRDNLGIALLPSGTTWSPTTGGSIS
jgi:predicted acylesterase/phospholipase RssA